MTDKEILNIVKAHMDGEKIEQQPMNSERWLSNHNVIAWKPRPEPWGGEK
jgi:hypothetical protein